MLCWIMVRRDLPDILTNFISPVWRGRVACRTGTGSYSAGAPRLVPEQHRHNTILIGKMPQQAADEEKRALLIFERTGVVSDYAGDDEFPRLS